MSNVPRIFADYWHSVVAGGTVIVSTDTFILTLNADLQEQRRVMLLDDGEGCVRGTLTPSLAQQIDLMPVSITSTPCFRARLDLGGIVLHDPDLLFYASETMTSAAGSNDTCRRLSSEDRKAFASFQEQASEDDLDAASVDLDHWLAFGAFEGDRLVSVASMYPWDNSFIADLGVLTLPEVRGRGHAAAVVRGISHLARTRGYEPQYRCQVDNRASIALAERVGFALFGQWEVAAS